MAKGRPADTHARQPYAVRTSAERGNPRPMPQSETAGHRLKDAERSWAEHWVWRWVQPSGTLTSTSVCFPQVWFCRPFWAALVSVPIDSPARATALPWWLTVEPWERSAAM